MNYSNRSPIDPSHQKEPTRFVIKTIKTSSKGFRYWLKIPFVKSLLSNTLFLILQVSQFKKRVLLKNQSILGLTLSYSPLIKNLSNEVSQILLNDSYRVAIPQSFIEELNSNSSLKDQKVVLLTGHLGNHEFLGQTLSALGVPIQGFYQKQQSPFWNKVFKSYRRQRGDYAPWEVLEFPKALKNFKRHPFTMGFLWDQFSNSSKAFEGKLKNQSFKTHNLPLRVFEKANSLCLYAFLIQNNNQKAYELIYQWGASPEQFHSFYFETMLKFPEQWYGGLHKLFKDKVDY